MESQLPRSPDFSQRHAGSEWMDLGLSPLEMQKNYREIERINRFMGVWESLFQNLNRLASGKNHLRILEAGSGSGGALHYLQQRAKSSGKSWEFAGAEINPFANRLANQRFERQSNGLKPKLFDQRVEEVLRLEGPFDILLGSLFLHHLRDEEIVELLSLARQKLGVGMVWDDLRRSPRNFYGFRFLSFAAGFSKVSRHDGAMSVLRSFRAPELVHLARLSGWERMEIHNRGLWGRFLLSARID